MNVQNGSMGFVYHDEDR